jgi:hypothetical protein
MDVRDGPPLPWHSNRERGMDSHQALRVEVREATMETTWPMTDASCEAARTVEDMLGVRRET